MKIAFQDFYSATVNQGGMFKQPEYETSAQLMSRVNDWVESEGVKIINIETVVTPAESANQPLVGIDGEIIAHWYQFFRVWYQAV